MAVGEVFTVGLIKLNGASPVTIGQVENVRPSPGLRDLILRGAGQVDMTFVALDDARPTIAFSSPMIKTILDATGVQGTAINSGATYTSVDLYLQQYDEGAKRKAGANHLKMSVNEAVLQPRTLRATQGGPAMIDMVLVISYDGTNAPITFTASQSLPSAAAASEAFTLGPVSLSGVAQTGLQGWTMDFGLTEIVLAGEGEEYPTFVATDIADPRATVMCSKASYLATLGLAGAAVSGSDCIFYLRKYAEGAARVGAATAGHIKLTIDEGRVEPADMTWGGGPGVAAFRVVPTYDGSNATLVLDTSSAIT